MASEAAVDYAVTLTGPVSDLDAFEGVLDALPEGALVGGVGYGPSAELIFTVAAPDPLGALAAGTELLDRRGVPVRDGAALRVQRHLAGETGAQTTRTAGPPREFGGARR